MNRPRLIFAGNFHWNAGSSQTITAYAEVADTLGLEVGVSAELSRLDDRTAAHLPMIADLRWATHLILVFEGRQFLNEAQLELCQRVPRDRRVVIDPDGHWGPPLRDGDDTSWGGYTHASWQELYLRLSDVILQPRAHGPLPEGAQRFSYFGMPRMFRLATELPAPADAEYQMQYIGNNWWRWQSLTGLVEAVRRVLTDACRIRVAGQWWDGAGAPGHTLATASEPGWLAGRGVEVAASVPFGQVVSEMSRGAMTPVLARPLLARMLLLTPRMWETLASGSLPLLTPEIGFLAGLWGSGAEQFVMTADGGETIDRVLRTHARLRHDLAEIQRDMYEQFRYERVLLDLARLLC